MTVLMLDDHSMVRESLAHLLRSRHGFEVLPAGTPAEAIRLLTRTPIRVAVVDYDLGQYTALDFISESRTKEIRIPILILTAGVTSVQAVTLMQLPIAGLILKHRPVAELAEVIDKVARGESYWDPQTVAEAISAHKPSTALTARERAVLSCVFDGDSNKAIALHLTITESQVKTIVQKLFFKTGARTRAQLVRTALDRPELLS